jgi:hypothetical protein
MILLRQLVAQKLSARQIAHVMDCTRNAIIGKCHRLKLSLANAKGRREFAQEPKRKFAQEPKRKGKRPWPVAAWPPWKPRQRDKKAADASGSQPVPITHLTEKTCRWPLWAQDTPSSLRMYCGAEAVEGLAYCPHHGRLAYVKPNYRQ